MVIHQLSSVIVTWCCHGNRRL